MCHPKNRQGGCFHIQQSSSKQREVCETPRLLLKLAREQGSRSPCLNSETLGPFKGVYRDITPIMENQMEKKMENEMETGIILGLYRGYIGIMGIMG